MCEVVNRHALQEAGIGGFALTQAEVEARLAEQRESKHEEKAIASVILELAEGKDARFRLSKPDFARLLARYALDHPEIDNRRRPLLELDHMEVVVQSWR